MTTEYKPYVGDVGTIIEIDLQEDISLAIDLLLKVKKPKATGGWEEVEWIPTLYGTDKLQYVITADDFDVAGDYIIQPSLTLGSWIGLADTVIFKVYSEYE